MLAIPLRWVRLDRLIKKRCLDQSTFYRRVTFLSDIGLNMLHVRVRFILVLAAVSVCLGCSGGADGGKRVPVYKVTGKITMHGGPLAGAMVSFAPKEGQPVAVGTTNDTGVFSLTTYSDGDGAAVGTYGVVVMKVKSAQQSPVEEGHGTDVSKDYTKGAGHSAQAAKDTGNMLPEKYADSQNTPLTAKVEPNSNNNFSFEIK